jgi:hypothetical protein
MKMDVSEDGRLEVLKAADMILSAIKGLDSLSDDDMRAVNGFIYEVDIADVEIFAQQLKLYFGGDEAIIL